MRIKAFVLLLVLLLVPVLTLADGTNLIQNPSFEDSVNGSLVGWYSYRQIADDDITKVLAEERALSGRTGISIYNFGKNYAALKQDFTGKKNSIYRISCYAMTLKAAGAPDEKGANIAIEGLDITSPELTGDSKSWVLMELYVRTIDIDAFTVCLALGSKDQPAAGRVTFDDVSIEQVSAVPQNVECAVLSSEKFSATPAPTPVPAPKLAGPPKTIWYWLVACGVLLLGGVFLGLALARRESKTPIDS